MASFGSIPRDGNTVEFLYEQRQPMLACDSAVQHSAVGGDGFGGVAAGLQAIRPLFVMLQMACKCMHARNKSETVHQKLWRDNCTRW